MAKIPFTLEAWFADRSQRVETRDGRPARIICTDAKADDGACVIALITDYGGEEAYQFFPDGRAFSSKSSIEDCADLFLITPEPELSEFEKVLLEIVHRKPEEATEIELRGMRIYQDKLLAITRKEIEKDLPRWKKCTKNTFRPSDYEHFEYRKDGCYLVIRGLEILLPDIAKLPKEE